VSAVIVIGTGYEETGKFIEFHLLLGHDVMGTDREEALSQLAKSDFFILTVPNSRETGLESDKTSRKTSSDTNFELVSILRRLNPFTEHAAQATPSGILLEGSTASFQRFPMLQHHLLPFYYFRHYDECVSNDFVLSGGGKNVELLNSGGMRDYIDDTCG
jgi:hypothetical protein